MNRLIYGITLLCTIVFFTACDREFLSTDITPENIASNTTSFKIRMTDAPVEYEEVNIDLQDVIIYGKNKKETDSIELGTNAGIYNLLDFQNGLDTLIASAMLSIDTIKQVKLILGENNTVKVAGEVFDLTIPGNAKNGLRIKLCIPLVDFEEFILHIDFDAAKSVKETGNGYKLKPVIRVLNTDIPVEYNDENEGEEEEENEGEEEEGDTEETENNGKPDTELSELILDFIATNYSEYKIKGTDSLQLCEGTMAIQVNIQDKGDKIALYFDDTAAYLQKSTSLKLKDLPDNILTTIDEKFAGFKPTNPLSTITLSNDTIQYQLTIRKGNEQKVVIIGSEGNIICQSDL